MPAISVNSRCSGTSLEVHCSTFFFWSPKSDGVDKVEMRHAREKVSSSVSFSALGFGEHPSIFSIRFGSIAVAMSLRGKEGNL